MRVRSKIVAVTSLAAITLSLSSCTNGFVTWLYGGDQVKKEVAVVPLVMPDKDADVAHSGSFWQELPDGGKVRCILTSGPGTNSSGLSCDWNQSMGKYAEADEKPQEAPAKRP